MIILALDVTSEYGSIALRRDQETVAEITLHSPEGFAHLIFPAIQEVLDQALVRLAEIDCFASASGPGSFTGVRIGLATAKGLAEAEGKPAVGISNLRALGSFGNFDRRAIVMDARRGEVFTGLYNSSLAPIVPEAVLKFPTWLDSLCDTDYEFIFPTGSPFGKMLAETRFAGMPTIEAPGTLAAAVADCAELDHASWRDPAALDANYVRRSDAELFWKDA